MVTQVPINSTVPPLVETAFMQPRLIRSVMPLPGHVPVEAYVQLRGAENVAVAPERPQSLSCSDRR